MLINNIKIERFVDKIYGVRFCRIIMDSSPSFVVRKNILRMIRLALSLFTIKQVQVEKYKQYHKNRFLIGFFFFSKIYCKTKNYLL